MYTIKPGYLIAVKVTRCGGVHYMHDDFAVKENEDGNGREVKEWKTTRVISDKEEFERSTIAQNRAGNLIRGACIATPFGSICTEDMIDDLDKAIDEAKKMAHEFNESAKYERIDVRVLKGKIASDDTEALKAITGELMDLGQSMKEGITKADVKQIRDAASLAKRMGQMLDADDRKRVDDAVERARKVARNIVSRVEKKGENLEKVINEFNLTPVDNLRTAFLDLEEEPVENGESMPEVDVQRVSSLDLG